MKSDIENLLQEVRTVVIIGCSANKYRTSYHIANYLKENGIRIIPVNPNYEEILGVRCHDKITELPGDIEVDIVDIFRDSQYTAAMVRDIINWSENHKQKPVVWTQLAVSSEEAKKLAEEAGFTYVENECIMVHHERISG